MPKARGEIVLAVLVAVLGLSVASALAAPGSLDVSFSGDGRATIDFGADEYHGGQDSGVAVAPDGGIVTVGSSTILGARGFAIARQTPDGGLDDSFSSDGRQIVQISGSGAEAEAVAIQPDGKIVVAGTSGGSSAFDPAIVRLNPDGSVDRYFAQDGVFRFSFFTGPDSILDIALQPDGKIVLAGVARENNNWDLAIARLLPGGKLDPSFSSDGKQTLSRGSYDIATGVAIQPDGKIVVAGTPASDDALLVARLQDDGGLDGLFGTSGFASAKFGTAAQSTSSVAVQPDGSIVVVGSSGERGSALPDEQEAREMAVARFDASGNLDLGFSEDGKTTVDYGAEDYATDLAIQGNGRIVVSGATFSVAARYDIAVARLESNGALDPSFASSGRARTDFGGDERGSAVVIQPDGQIVAATTTSNGKDFALARFDGDPTGVPPPGPGGGGGGGAPAKCAGQKATKTGTAKRDVLTGTKRRDVIAGLGGNDLIRGLGGNDLICGGAGKDKLLGGAAKDRLLGGAGADLLFGQGGKDTLKGGPGDDRQHQ